MPKRQLHINIDPTVDIKPDMSSSPSVTASSSPSTPEPTAPEKKPRLSNVKTDLKKGVSPRKVTKEKAGTKTAWNAEEDQILLGIMDQLIKSHLWPLIKADGRLVHRTSYGAQYHARMLLAKGTGGKAK